MNTTTEYRPQTQQEADSTNEFEPIPWALQMQALTAALRVRGHAIPENATVSLIPVPPHLRGENGRPLYRVAIVSPDDNEVKR